MSTMKIRTKLFLTVLTLAVPLLVLVGGLAYVQGKSAVERTTFEHLTSVRAGKANQIESYFDQIRKQARTLVQSRMVVEAMAGFDEAHKELEYLELTDEQRSSVGAHYRDVYLPRLASHTEKSVDIAPYLPSDLAEEYLQYHYIAANPIP